MYLNLADCFYICVFFKGRKIKEEQLLQENTLGFTCR